MGMNHLIFFKALAAEDALTGEGLSNAVNGVDTLSGTISKYGLPIVIMAVFFIIFLLLVFLILHNNAKMMKQLVEHQNHSDKTEEELLSKLVDSALESKIVESDKGPKNNINNNNEDINAGSDSSKQQITEDAIHKDLVGAYIDVNMAFKDASRSALQDLNCARVAIYVFHNGNKSIHGLPFFKMSCVHEWTNKGSNTLRGKSHMDLPLHVFSDFIEDLWKNGVYKSEDVEKSAKNDMSLCEFTAYSKTKALYLDAIKDDKGLIAGFVVAEFEDVDTFETDKNRDHQVKKVLDNMIMKISSILIYHFIPNK